VTGEQAVLDDVERFLARFVAYPSEHARVAHTLWIAHTHLMETWDSTPRIAFLSPEPGSGKTRAIEVTELLVPNPVEAVNVTPAYLFRKVGECAPTILYDEIDTVFGPKAKDNEEIRGLLNAGHRRGAVAGRCVVRGKVIETEEIPAYCAVALAGLGGLPETLLSRSIVIRMRRRTSQERVEPFRRRLQAPDGNALRDRLGLWAKSVTDVTVVTDLPEGVEDRSADLWEDLITIADLVGGRWPSRARNAAITIVSDTLSESASLGVLLLRDLRTVFDESDLTAMFTREILGKLHEIEESPWFSLPLDARRLSRMLSEYRVSVKTVRIGAEIGKGYYRHELEDPWRRYCQAPVTSVTSVTADAFTEAEQALRDAGLIGN
jgi:hypothetical protein